MFLRELKRFESLLDSRIKASGKRKASQAGWHRGLHEQDDLSFVRLVRSSFGNLLTFATTGKARGEKINEYSFELNANKANHLVAVAHILSMNSK